MRALTKEEYAVLTDDGPAFDGNDDTTYYEKIADGLVRRGLLIRQDFDTDGPYQWTYDRTPLGELAVRVSRPTSAILI